MKILLLFVILHQGDVRYKMEEFTTMKECQEFKDAIIEIVHNDAPGAKVIRAECFEVGQVVSR